MILIAHRGNVTGPSSQENSPDHILKALELGFDVEVDVWFVDNKFMLGHDKPKYHMPSEFVNNNKVWFHAKNVEAFTRLMAAGVHCFWHDKDEYTITSKGKIWGYPGKKLLGLGISVVQGKGLPDFPCEGVCSDFVGELDIS